MIKVGNKLIGKGAPCFIAAEIGINHNGDMDLACKMIDAAKEAGADAIKFQNYKTEDFVLNKELTYDYISGGKKVTETQFDMFKRYELTREQLKFLKAYSDKVGLTFFSTPTGEDGIQDLLDAGCELFKNGSDYLVNLELIQAFARTGKPLIISTGMSVLGEIDDAVRAFEEAGGKELLILHCTSQYPTPPLDVHLNKITTLKTTFPYPIGFSDHSDGIIAAVGSVALGAVFIEKHYTLDKNLPGPDHRFSMDPKELKELVTAVRAIEQNMGSLVIGPTASEAKGRRDYRLSCIVNKDVPAGHQLTESDIIFSRPATGLPPKFKSQLVGRKLVKALKVGQVVTLDSLNG